MEKLITAFFPGVFLWVVPVLFDSVIEKPRRPREGFVTHFADEQFVAAGRRLVGFFAFRLLRGAPPPVAHLLHFELIFALAFYSFLTQKDAFTFDAAFFLLAQPAVFRHVQAIFALLTIHLA